MKWSTVSKALAKSIKIAAQHCLESRGVVTSFNKTIQVAVTHPLPEQKLDCIPERIL
jgi:hypothetical protein